MLPWLKCAMAVLVVVVVIDVVVTGRCVGAGVGGNVVNGCQHGSSGFDVVAHGPNNPVIEAGSLPGATVVQGVPELGEADVPALGATVWHGFTSYGGPEVASTILGGGFEDI